jgi:serine/threonine protein kinase
MASEARANSSRRYAPIGKYDLLAHIATGGMGAIYKAVDRDSGTVVALKILSPTLLASRPNLLERFRREARRGVRLRHENLVAIHEWGEENGIYYLALEYVDGVDLHEYVNRRGPLEPLPATMILIQAVRALDYLYQQEVVHRDIKPSNFLISEQDGELFVKLTDLGVARDAGEDEFRVTQEGFTVGTVDYMAPEQARDSSLADIRSDLYSLGCTFFHMLAGRPPFPEGGLTERLYKHAEDAPPDISEINARVSPALATVVRRMLAKRPADRYQTPGELLRALGRLGQSSATRAPESLTTGAAGATPAQAPGAESSRRGIPTPDLQANEPTATSLRSVLPEHRRVAAGQFDRANQVIATGNFDYGIHLLMSCCKLDPANLLYRQTLRRFERTRCPRGASRRWLGWWLTFPARTRFKTARQAGEHLKVLEYGEEILCREPWDAHVHCDMGHAAEQLGLIPLAVWLLEQAWDRNMPAAALTRNLARLYEQQGNFKKAVLIWQHVLKTNPANTEAHQEVKDLAARETIARGQYAEIVDGRADE